jgi:hypothetical protein
MQTFTVFILISILAVFSYEPKSPKVLAYLRETSLMMMKNSKMRIFNVMMTVQKMINFVAFLQPKHKLKPITYTHYGQYRML